MNYHRIKELISQASTIPVDKLTPESKLQSDLHLDSLDTIELLMAFEEEFQTEFPDDILDGDVSIAQVVDKVNANLND